MLQFLTDFSCYILLNLLKEYNVLISQNKAVFPMMVFQRKTTF